MASNIYIDCNRQNSILKNNQNNNEWTFQLGEGLRIPKGSSIQINNSLINVKGLSGSTIEIEEDIEESIRFLYYYTFSDAIRAARYEEKGHDPDIVNKIGGTGGPYDPPHSDYYKVNVVHFKNNTYQNIGQYGSYGFPNFPIICMEADSNGKLTPLLGTANIIIPKGKYSVDNLSQLIEDQCLGRTQTTLDKVRTQINYISDLISKNKFNGYLDNGSFINKIDVFAATFFDSSGNFQGMGNNDVANKKGIFVSPKSFNWYIQRLNSNQDTTFNDLKNSGENYYLIFDYIERKPSGTHGWEKNANTNYSTATDNMYIGTSDFTFTYDEEKSGFSFTNLHQSFKQDSLNYKGIKNTSPGDQIARFKFMSRNVLENQPELTKFHSTPLTRIGGILVLNWAYNYSVKNADITLGNTKKDTYIADYGNFSDFFKNPEKQWENTIWYRLGFLYDQIQNKTIYESWRDDVGSPLNILPGFTTDADLDISIHSSLVGQPTANANSNNDIYQSYGWGIQSHPYFDPRANSNPGKDQSYMNFLTVSFSDVLVSSKSIVGYKLPTLSKNGYYLITSDIVDTFSDSVKNTRMPILGIVPKSTTSSQDFISYINPMIHTINQDKLVNSISIKVLNPDLTDPDLDPNSTVIIQISIPPSKLLTQGQLIEQQKEQKEKPKEKN